MVDHHHLIFKFKNGLGVPFGALLLNEVKMITEEIERLSTAAYENPTILLTNLITKYDVPPTPVYFGDAVEVYASDEIEMVVCWPDEMIVVYKKEVADLFSFGSDNDK